MPAHDRSASDTVLDIAGLTVRYGAFTALEDVGFSVGTGEKVALLGHNGAGKSTLFRTVLGFIRPASGAVTIAGHAPGSDAARLSVSYLPEQVAFQKTLTGAEIIATFARLKGEPVARATALLETVGLADAAKRRVGAYSKGMRQRLGLAVALIGRPRLMLLDEPTSGLDPISRQDFYAIIGRVAAEGTAVLLSSHSLTEVEAKTDRVAILTKGRLVADAPLAELSARARLPIQIRVEARPGAVDQLHRDMGGIRFNGRSVILTCAAEEKLPLMARLSGLGDLVTDIEITPPGLDDVYRHFSARDGQTEVKP
jgi:Cu-processing system ATP-binding protein